MKTKKSLLIIFVVLIIALLISVNTTSAYESKLFVYSASGQEITGPIFELFNVKHPDIEIVSIHAGTPELFARLNAEQNNPAADVMFGGSPLLYDSSANLFKPYDHPDTKSFVTSDPNSIWHPFTIFAQPIMLNTEMVNESDYPATVKELLANGKKWKEMGGIALADPSKSSTGWTIISGVATAYGWDFIKDLLSYCVITPGSDPMFTAIKDGEAPIGWINEDLGVKWELEGLPVKLIYPEDAITVQMDAYGIVKNGPNPVAAEKFVNFLGTQEVHILVANIIKRRSARTDVNPPGELPKMGDLKLFYASEPREVVVDKFNALMKELGN